MEKFKKGEIGYSNFNSGESEIWVCCLEDQTNGKAFTGIVIRLEGKKYIDLYSIRDDFASSKYKKISPIVESQEITRADIINVEAIHDILIDYHGYSNEFVRLRDLRALIKKIDTTRS